MSFQLKNSTNVCEQSQNGQYQEHFYYIRALLFLIVTLILYYETYKLKFEYG